MCRMCSRACAGCLLGMCQICAERGSTCVQYDMEAWWIVLPHISGGLPQWPWATLSATKAGMCHTRLRRYLAQRVFCGEHVANECRGLRWPLGRYEEQDDVCEKYAGNMPAGC